MLGGAEFSSGAPELKRTISYSQTRGRSANISAFFVNGDANRLFSGRTPDFPKP